MVLSHEVLIDIKSAHRDLVKRRIDFIFVSHCEPATGDLDHVGLGVCGGGIGNRVLRRGRNGGLAGIIRRLALAAGNQKQSTNQERYKLGPAQDCAWPSTRVAGGGAGEGTR